MRLVNVMNQTSTHIYFWTKVHIYKWLIKQKFS